MKVTRIFKTAVRSLSRIKETRAQTIYKALLALAIASFLFGLAWRNIVNYDIWWHLAAGRDICDQHHIPAQDSFTFTSKGNIWIDLHWGFQVMVFKAYSLLGPAGLVGLKTAALFAAWLALFFIPWTRSHFLLTGVFFALGMAAGLNSYLVRPAAVSLAFLAACLALLESGMRGNHKRLWLLVPLQMLWVNFHGLFIMGLFCIYSYLAGEILQWLIARRRDKAEIPAHLKTLALAAAASTLACLLNPYHYHGLMFPFQLFQELSGLEGLFSQATLEFTPPYYTLINTFPLRAFRLLLWLSAFSFIFNLKGIRLRMLIMYLGFAYLALIAVRNLLPFGLVAAVVSVYNFGQAWKAVRDKVPFTRSTSIQKQMILAGTFIIVLTLCSLTWMLAMDRIKTDAPFGARVQWSRYPVGAAAFIVRESLPGPGFNVFMDGGYLIWRLYPDHKVFIDGRQQVAGKEFFKHYTWMVTEPRNWDELSRKWDLNYVLINHTNEAYHDLIRMLYHHYAYSLVYLDNVSLLWVKRTGRNAGTIRKHEIRMNDIEHVPPPTPAPERGPSREQKLSKEKAKEFLNLGNLYAILGLHNRAMKEYSRAAVLDPSSAEIYFQIGVLMDDEGNMDEAREYAAYSLSMDPGLMKANVLLAMLNEETDPELAIELYEKALAAFPHYGEVHKSLALLYLKQGRFKKALEQIEAARSDKSYKAPAELDLYETQALAGLEK